MLISTNNSNKSEKEMKKMTKKEKIMENLHENYFPTEDIIPMAVDSRVRHGCLENYIFFDKRFKMFLIVDMHGISDYQTKSEKKLCEKILKNPQRFIKFPQFTSEDNWEIMCNFAEEIGDENLLIALQGDGAFSAFYNEINSRNLNEQFGEFQKKHYNRIFKKWCEEHNITEKIEF